MLYLSYIETQQEDSAWRITAPSGEQPSENTKRRRAASLRSSPLQTARRRPWLSSSRCARHNVYAYRLREGSRERYSDDGEPAKTAGTPALEVLQHSGLTDLIVVITRYFGGVLLGTGGLVRAYTTATSRALEAAEVVTVRSVVALDVTVDYGLYERADLLIKAAGGKLAEPEFTDKVTLRWQMPEHTEGPLLTQLQELTRGMAKVAVSEPFYAAF